MIQFAECTSRSACPSIQFARRAGCRLQSAACGDTPRGRAHRTARPERSIRPGSSQGLVARAAARALGVARASLPAAMRPWCAEDSVHAHVLGCVGRATLEPCKDLGKSACDRQLRPLTCRRLIVQLVRRRARARRGRDLGRLGRPPAPVGAAQHRRRDGRLRCQAAKLARRPTVAQEERGLRRCVLGGERLGEEAVRRRGRAQPDGAARRAKGELLRAGERVEGRAALRRHTRATGKKQPGAGAKPGGPGADACGANACCRGCGCGGCGCGGGGGGAC